MNFLLYNRGLLTVKTSLLVNKIPLFVTITQMATIKICNKTMKLLMLITNGLLLITKTSMLIMKELLLITKNLLLRLNIQLFKRSLDNVIGQLQKPTRRV